VRCQSEALAHHVSTLAAARRAVNRKFEIASLRLLVAKREPNSNGDAEAKQPEVEALIA
jgi:hypothetical protein